MGTTKANLRQRIMGGAYLGDGFASTATGGTAGTLVDSKIAHATDTFNGATIVHKPGAAGYEQRRITAFTTGGTFAVDRNFTSTPVNTDAYEVHRAVEALRIDDAINEAIRISGKRYARRTQDSTLVTAANKYGYNISSLSPVVDRDWGLEKVEYDAGITGTNPPYTEIPRPHWEVVDDNATLMLQFKEIVFDTNTRTWRLSYLVRPSVFTNDTDSLDPDTVNFQNFICAYATSILCAEQGGEPGGKWNRVFLRMQKILEDLKGDVPHIDIVSAINPSFGFAPGGYEHDVSVIRI